jgi:hypothetical protein
MTATPLPCRLVEAPIDLGDLLHPSLTFPVIEVHDLSMGPVKVIRDVGYLLKQTV